jgi:metallo-beta-lactamase family protein
MRLTFLGAAGTVTGSKYLVEAAGRRILVDCGLFQGYKQLRLRNWTHFPVPPSSLDAVVITHAHLDHSGYLPALVHGGYRGPIYSTAATGALSEVLLRDSAHLQEEEAEYANRRGFSRHKPALPLYTVADADAALKQFADLEWDTPAEIAPGVRVRPRKAGHLLGAATIELETGDGTVVFSGDLGRPNDPVMPAPEPVTQADYLLVESTYGDRVHSSEPPARRIAEVVVRTAARGGVLLIPSFAVGRAQLLMLYLYRLRLAGKIPDIPIYLNSPMAVNATGVYLRFHEEHRLSEDECVAMYKSIRVVESVEESKSLNALHTPAVIIAASGMATGGRVLHHLRAFAPEPRNSILFAGYQAGGTRGAALVGGAHSVRIHGIDVPVRAEVLARDTLSAHADGDEILEWLRNFKSPPRQTFVVHGDLPAADALRRRLRHELGWDAQVPDYNAVADLGEAAREAVPT